MKKISMFIAVLFLGAMAQSALAQNLVAFNGGIGDIPTGSANTTVRGVAGAGQIWVIRDLQADVKVDGRIQVDGRGLLLGQAIPSEATPARAYLRRCSAQMTRMSSTAQVLQASRFRQMAIFALRTRFRLRRRILALVRCSSSGPDSGSWFAAGIPFLMPSLPLPPMLPPAFER